MNISKEKALKLVQLTESRLTVLKAFITENNINSVEVRIAGNDVITPLNIMIEGFDEDENWISEFATQQPPNQPS